MNLLLTHLMAIPAPTSLPGNTTSTPSVNFSITLSLIVWLPAVAALVIAFVPARDERSLGRIRTTAFAFVAASLVVALWAYHNLNPGSGTAYEENYPFLAQLGSSYHLAMDGLSAPLLLINSVVGLVAIIYAWRLRTRVREFYLLLMVLQTAAAGVLAARDYLMFFLFWQMELVPVFLLVAFFGASGRGRAAMKYLAVAGVSSGLLLAAILLMQLKSGSHSFDMTTLNTAKYDTAVQLPIFLVLLAAFALKLPVFPLHGWLADLLEEAPTAVGVVVIGVLLRLGGYGLFRVALDAFPRAALRMAPFLAVVAILTLLYGILAAAAQDNLRRMVAHLSVAQAGLVLLGIASLTTVALDGAAFLLMMQGLVLAALLVLADMLHQRLGTWRASQMAGVASRLPVLTTLLLLTAVATLGMPGTGGFVGQVMTLVGAYPIHRKAVILAALLLVLMAALLLRTLRRVIFTPPPEEAARLADATTLEKWATGLLLGMVIWVGFLPSGPVISDTNVLEPGLIRVVDDGIKPIASHYTPTLTPVGK
ncbi:MAG: complex I subunit 4 family protein [Candidatus Dormibacteria bacterium]